MEQFRSSLDLGRIEDLESFDAVVLVELLAQRHDIRIVVGPGPVGARRIARHQVAVLRRGLDLVLRSVEAERVAVVLVRRPRPVGEAVRRDRGVPSEVAGSSLRVSQ